MKTGTGWSRSCVSRLATGGLATADAVITGPTLQIQTEVRGGRLVLVTKPGIEVDADDVAATWSPARRGGH